MEQNRAKVKVDVVNDLLAEHYGMPQWRQHLPPVDELVSTILSQNTSDTNRDRAFFALKERFEDWQSVLDANVDEIKETIKSAGLANQKAPRIQGALERILEERGSINLDFLESLPLKEAKEWLTSIPGVGPKTAAIVLLFAFGRPAFPVDTHVHRVTKRLGIIGSDVSAEKAHAVLEDLADPSTFYAFHLNLIKHGREICAARNPKCDNCFLQEQCDYYQTV